LKRAIDYDPAHPMPRRSRIHFDGVPLHAYVLRANHVHLLVTPTKAEAVPKFIISLGRR